MEKEKRNKNIMGILKNILFWVLIILYLEISFRLCMGFDFNIQSLINISLYSIMISTILSVISRIFKEKASNVVTAIILLILGVLFSVQCVFTKIFTTNFSLANLALGDQAAGFIGDAVKRNICKYSIYCDIFTSIYFILIP